MGSGNNGTGSGNNGRRFDGMVFGDNGTGSGNNDTGPDDNGTGSGNNGTDKGSDRRTKFSNPGGGGIVLLAFITGNCMLQWDSVLGNIGNGKNGFMILLLLL